MAGAAAARPRMMNVLALDTASPSPAVCLLAEERLYEEPLSADRRASEELLPAVRRVLAAVGKRLAECERVAVCAGPGSFTGVRIGLATAWGFGRALEIPVEPVSTLEAMAEAARPTGISRLVTALDAGRGEIICERFALEAARVRSVTPQRRLMPRELVDFADGEPIIALPASLLGTGGAAPPLGLAAAVALAVARAPRNRSLAEIRAIYSRPSAAEEKYGAS